MLKQDVINELQKKSGKTKKECGEFLDAFTEIISGALSDGDEVKIVNFGTFKKRKIAEHDGVDPITKKKIRVKETAVPYFKVSKVFKNTVLAGS